MWILSECFLLWVFTYNIATDLLEDIFIRFGAIQDGRARSPWQGRLILLSEENVVENDLKFEYLTFWWRYTPFCTYPAPTHSRVTLIILLVTHTYLAYKAQDHYTHFHDFVSWAYMDLKSRRPCPSAAFSSSFIWWPRVLMVESQVSQIWFLI